MKVSFSFFTTDEGSDNLLQAMSWILSTTQSFAQHMISPSLHNDQYGINDRELPIIDQTLLLSAFVLT